MNDSQKGFTLVEMVVVIIVVGILSAVLLPKLIDINANAGTVKVKAVASAISSSASMQFVASQLPSGGSYSPADACAGAYLDADTVASMGGTSAGMKSGAGLPVNCSSVVSGTAAVSCVITCNDASETVTLPAALKS
ncbi:MAG: prepilin-type N-terminal cleavage/methylation domain-containing protein [Sterolibacteriaceae bacterium MAG5]|nr:prepilin-type N-terminal cleavage/methylation domain-containing protein [Candidatus Nitricoxidireducens bremensis]